MDQTTFGQQEGNCFSSCVASIFELPLKDVPHFCKRQSEDEPEEQWYYRLLDWLAPKGLTAICIIPGNDFELKDTYAILSGESPRGDFLHSVVWLNGEIVHDPHPSRDGLKTKKDFIFFVVMDAAKFKREF